MGLRLTTWNIAWFGQLLKGMTRTLPTESRRVDTPEGLALQTLQRRQIAEEIRRISPDILCLQEGPSTGNVGLLADFCAQDLAGQWSVVTRGPKDPWHIRGSQGIFFLVRTDRLPALQPKLLAQSRWFEATEIESRIDINRPDSGEHKKTWPIVHPLFKPDGKPALPEPPDDPEGAEDFPDLGDREHSHYRHPQVLVLTVGNRRMDIIGCHLKSKFGGHDYARAGALRKIPPQDLEDVDIALIRQVQQTAVEARIKLSTEASNVRFYIESRFRNEPDPVVFVCGDMNDGVGKELFERQYLFHDTISNLQGDVFFSTRFLNHALFDFNEAHRWTTNFSDVWDEFRDPAILLDHILFTQAVSGSEALAKTGLQVPPGGGRVEHEIHNAVNAVFDSTSDFTSDHRPVTVDILTA